MNDKYTTPLGERYASKEMQYIFSPSGVVYLSFIINPLFIIILLSTYLPIQDLPCPV